MPTTINPSKQTKSRTDEAALKCYHCGEACPDETIHINEKHFCCNGCKAVFELLDGNDMCNYYAYDDKAGIKPEHSELPERFAYLDDAEIQQKLIDFSDGTVSSVTFNIPQMHCSSCIWLLEQLYKINPAISASRVNFLRKEASFRFDTSQLSLRGLVELLAQIGYEPKISLASMEKENQYRGQRQLYLKIGLAGFVFGNVMMLSFPEYLSRISHLPADFASFFGYLNIVLTIPALFYSGRDYFISAYTGLRQRYINIDVPISLGMFVLFTRSVYEIVSATGAGYLDSLTGLIFFLLIGKIFQQKTYDNLSFERDYKSYFPIAVTRLKEGMESVIPLARLEVGDRIVVRNKELIPADAILLNGDASIDYSFVTGESEPVAKQSGDMIYAGGRQVGSRLELEVIKEVSQSYLTRLWNDENATSARDNAITRNIDRVSKYFTIIIIAIAIIAGAYWYLTAGANTALFVFTAVLIVACPCALALSYPFTMGNAMRLLGRAKLFLKNVDVIERMARIQHLVFDKTGTLTHAQSSRVGFSRDLSPELVQYTKLVASQSTHPSSRLIYQYLANQYPDISFPPPDQYTETPGKGITAEIKGTTILLGSRDWIAEQTGNAVPKGQTSEVHLAINGRASGYFTLKHTIREGLAESIQQLEDRYEISILSGDNSAEEGDLRQIFGPKVPMFFEQSPAAKLDYIKAQKQRNQVTLMIGDGLNDGAAIRESNVGFSVAEATAAFTPASDGILNTEALIRLPDFLRFSAKSVKIVKYSFIISFLYNIIGLSFAVNGYLTPIVAAILMPISSLTVIAFSTLATLYAGRALDLKG
jgi:Cu+-exporting ATPase